MSNLKKSFVIAGFSALGLLVGCDTSIENDASKKFIEPSNFNAVIDTKYIKWDQGKFLQLSSGNVFVGANEGNDRLLTAGDFSTVAYGYPVVYVSNGVVIYEFMNVGDVEHTDFMLEVSSSGECRKIKDYSLTSIRCSFPLNESFTK